MAKMTKKSFAAKLREIAQAVADLIDDGSTFTSARVPEGCETQADGVYRALSDAEEVCNNVADEIEAG